MQKLSDFYMPTTFKDIQDHCDDSLKLSILGQEGVAHLACEINQPVRISMKECYILKLNLCVEGLPEALYCALGSDGRQYRSSSPLQKIDFNQGRILTYSGNVYGFSELRSDAPDIYVFEICATLNSYGLSKEAGMPPIVF